MAFNFVHSAPVRKAGAFLNRFPRFCKRIASSDQDYLKNPPIFVNSLPKSGTHLLMQVARQLPNKKYYGSFIAQTPSLTLKERSASDISMKIAAIVPGEVLAGHLHFSTETSLALARANVFNLFIWRDPRDVLISEAHYLSKMNRWHAMHRSFKACRNARERIALALEGDGSMRYPNARERVGAYMGWRSDANCIVVRFEDLINPETREAEIQRIRVSYAQRAQIDVSEVTALETLVAAIAPERSHTFNRGEAERWRTDMTEQEQDRSRQLLGEWLS